MTSWNGLSQRLSKDDMKRLASTLYISPQDVNISLLTSCTDPESIAAANHDILKNWLNRQDNRCAAYTTLGEALIHPDVGLNLIAREVLDYPPAKTENKLKSGTKRKRQRNRNKDERKKLKINGLSVKL